ncbi:MAG: DUF378 domain-containing protein [Clostridia bacterium]|nr:DUF378 domain-containing protein [Clostridia bacterium]MDD3862855.1 DUF378 domain-containing protein [Clostridia bacterium]
MKIANLVAFIILVLAGIVVLLDGLFVGVGIMLSIAGISILSEVVYILIGLSAIWLIFVAIANKGTISVTPGE